MSEVKGGIYLLLGGNLGNVVDSFQKVEVLGSDYFQVLRKSSLYQSEAWGMESEHLFLNQVWEIDTDLEPAELLQRVLAIEMQLGRERSNDENGYTDRPIDIDILLYQEKVITTEVLELPHPGMKQRAFTLLPLVELADDCRDPHTGLLYSHYLANLPDSEKRGIKRLDH